MKTENRLLRLPEVLERVPIEEFSQTFDYGLKDITKLDNFNQVVNWANSSFYQATNQSSSVIS